MAQDIAKLAIALSVDASDIGAGMDRATAMANTAAGRMNAGLMRRGADPFAQKAIKENLELFKQAEEIKQSQRSATSKRMDELNRLDLMHTKGFLTDEQHARARAGVAQQADDIKRELNRRTIHRIGAGATAGLSILGDAAEASREGTEMSVQKTVGHLGGALAGVAETFGPIAGAVVGVAGSIVTGVVGLIEDALTSTRKKAFAIFDDIVAGGKTMQQGLRAAATQGMETTLRQLAQLQNNAGNTAGGVDLSAAFSAEDMRANADAIRDRLQRELDNPARRLIIREISTRRARDQAADQIQALSDQAQRTDFSLPANEMERLAIAQRLAAQNGQTLQQTMAALRDRMRELAPAQDAVSAAQARAQLRDTARDYLAQGSAIGRTAFEAEDAARRFTAAQALVQQTGMSMAQARRQLAGTQDMVSANAAATLVTGLSGRVRDVAQQGLDQAANFVGFGRSVAGTAGPGQVATTTEESIARQQQLRQIDTDRQRLDQQANATNAAANERINALIERRRQLNVNQGPETPEMEAARIAQAAAIQQQIRQQQDMALQRMNQLGMARQQLDADRQRLAANDELLRRMELQRNALAEGNQLRINLRAPLEQYNDELARLDNLMRRGAISEETFRRAMGQAQDRAEQAAGGPIDRSAAALGFGTTGAISAINRYRASQSEQESPMGRLLRVQEQLRQMQADAQRMQREQLQAQRQLNTNVAAGYVLAALNLAGR